MGEPGCRRQRRGGLPGQVPGEHVHLVAGLGQLDGAGQADDAGPHHDDTVDHVATTGLRTACSRWNPGPQCSRSRESGTERPRSVASTGPGSYLLSGEDPVTGVSNGVVLQVEERAAADLLHLLRRSTSTATAVPRRRARAGRPGRSRSGTDDHVGEPGAQGADCRRAAAAGALEPVLDQALVDPSRGRVVHTSWMLTPRGGRVLGVSAPSSPPRRPARPGGRRRGDAELYGGLDQFSVLS